MLGFVILAWNPDLATALIDARIVRSRMRVLARSYGVVLDVPGLTAYSNSGVPAPPVDGVTACGLLVGTAFKHDGTAILRPSPGVQLLYSASHASWITSQGRRIISDVWGSYVVALSSARGVTHVVRSPVALMPCYFAQYRTVTVFFSSVETFSRLQLVDLDIDWTLITAQAANGDHFVRQAALRPVTIMDCGECVSVRDDKLIHSKYWSPTDVARNRCIEDFDEAAIRIRTATQLCVNAWASQHEALVHSLSGGIDSSIVLSCLKRAPNKPRIVCVNNYTPQPRGDERRYARSMATAVNCELIERVRNPNVDLSMFTDINPTVRPIVAFSDPHTYPANMDLARSRGATAIFDGELGDNLFGSVVGHEVLTEYVQRRGLTPGFLAQALYFARLKKWSLTRAVTAAIRDARARSSPARWSLFEYVRSATTYDHLHCGLISQSALDNYRQASQRLIHPWLLDMTGVPIGKLVLLYGLIIVSSYRYHRPFYKEGDPSLVSPLISQPLVDEALQISSHLHIRGGIDRAVARNAFGSDLSTLVLNRTGKGNNSFWLRDVVDHNRAFLLSFLLDGHLVKQGILDSRKVEATLSRAVQPAKVAVTEVLVQLYIEAWVRRWMDLLQQRKAIIHPRFHAGEVAIA